MKILFISDIHGIDINLKKMDEIINKENIDKIICLGDILNPNYGIKVVEFLNKYKNILLCMKGNCDSNKDELMYNQISGLKKINVDGLDIYLNHGHKYRIDKGNFDGNILVYGHKHIPYIKKDNNKIFICVGSISLPRDEYGSTYMIYENKDFKIFDMDGNIIDEIEI